MERNNQEERFDIIYNYGGEFRSEKILVFRGPEVCTCFAYYSNDDKFEVTNLANWSCDSSYAEIDYIGNH